MYLNVDYAVARYPNAVHGVRIEVHDHPTAQVKVAAAKERTFQ